MTFNKIDHFIYQSVALKMYQKAYKTYKIYNKIHEHTQTAIHIFLILTKGSNNKTGSNHDYIMTLQFVTINNNKSYNKHLKNNNICYIMLI